MPVARIKLNLFLSNFIVDLGLGHFFLGLSIAVVEVEIDTQQQTKSQQYIKFGPRLVKGRVPCVRDYDQYLVQAHGHRKQQDRSVPFALGGEPPPHKGDMHPQVNEKCIQEYPITGKAQYVALTIR